MCKSNCITQNVLLDPQAQTAAQAEVHSRWHHEWKLTLYFVGLPEHVGEQGKVDATYSRLDRSEDFLFLFRLFRCTFMTLWWRTLWFGWCCMCQDPKRKTKQGFTRKVKYIFLFHSGVRNRGEKATKAVLESKTPVSLVHYYIFPERLRKKILLSCDLYRCSWPLTEAKPNCPTTVNQCGCKYCLICTRDWVCRWLKLPHLAEAISWKACIGIQCAPSQTHP